MSAGREIVVGVDGSAESKLALRWAIEEARLRGCDVLAVHAWVYPVFVESFMPGEVLFDGALLRSAAEELLEAAVGEVAGAAGDVPVRRVTVEGEPVEVLVEASAGAELLVVGTRGAGGFGGLRLGSVSHRCTQEALCPVVVARAEDDPERDRGSESPLPPRQ